MKTEWLVPDDTRVEFEAGLFEAFATAWVAAIENRHIVLLGDGIDGVEKREEVLFGVDVLFAMGGQEDVFALFKTEAFVNVAGLDIGEISMKHFRHW